jgi:predicted MPP superfamily phosphohydrolase
MFHLFILLAYTIPNIYVFFRIRYLFISSRYRHWYTLVYLLIASVYPLTIPFSHRDLNTIVQVLTSISEYILALYFYLFLFVLLYDIFLLVNLLFGILSSEIRKSFLFRFYVLSTMVVLSIAVVITGAINLNTIRVSTYRIEVSRKKSNIKHLRVGFIADFHIQQSTRLRYVKQFVRKINALQPELMLYGGDIIEGDNENETTVAIESEIKNIHTKYGSYGVVGNHEFYGGQEQGRFFRKAGITLLCDTIVRVNNSFYLAGRYDQHFGQRKSLSQILDSVSPDLPIILLDHRPNDLKDTNLSSIDIQFSGHTHNGQMFPLNFITKSIYELSWGYKKIRNTHVFVTSGLRLWGPPVKTTGKSEIMLVDIYFN